MNGKMSAIDTNKNITVVIRAVVALDHDPEVVLLERQHPLTHMDAFVWILAQKQIVQVRASYQDLLSTANVYWNDKCLA
jgi:hypothetical protein